MEFIIGSGINVNGTVNPSFKIDGHINNKSNPHEVGFDNILGENPSYTKLESDDKYIPKVTGESLVDDTEITKLATVAENANNYVLPSDVVQDSEYVHTDNNYSTEEKNKVENDDGVDGQGIVDLGTQEYELVVPYLLTKTVYRGKIISDQSNVSCLIYSQAIPTGINYRLELILEIECSEIPTLDIYNPTAYDTIWIIPPSIEYPHTINKFVFETWDGGVTWYGNQCYSFEVV